MAGGLLFFQVDVIGHHGHALFGHVKTFGVPLAVLADGKARRHLDPVFNDGPVVTAPAPISTPSQRMASSTRAPWPTFTPGESTNA